MRRMHGEATRSLLKSLSTGLLVIVFASACMGPRHATAPGIPSAASPTSLTPLADGRFRLLLERPPLNAEPLSMAEARAILAEFRATWPSPRSPPRLQLAAYPPHGPHTSWQQELWHDYARHYGTDQLPIPGQLEQHRFRLALQLAPKYMPDGFRDAAQELLTILCSSRV